MISGNGSPDRYRFSLSGPRFWLAYVAAVGTGMCSIPFLDWLRARAGLVPIHEAGAISALFSVQFLSALLVLFFLGAWVFAWRRFPGDRDIEKCGMLLLLVFAGSVPGFTSVSLTLSLMGDGDESAFFLYYIVFMLITILIPLPFAVRDPRHGFFCAAFNSIEGLGVLMTMDGNENAGLYLTGGRMAVVFLYFTAGIRVQRVLAAVLSMLAFVHCSPGLLGAAVGTVAWGFRRNDARRREAPGLKAGQTNTGGGEREELSTHGAD